MNMRRLYAALLCPMLFLGSSGCAPAGGDPASPAQSAPPAEPALTAEAPVSALTACYAIREDGTCELRQRQVQEGALDACRWEDSFFLLKEDGTAWLYEDPEGDGGTRLLDGVREIDGHFLLQEDGTLWETGAEGTDCTLRRIGEGVSYAAWMYAWDCFLCLDQDGVLSTLTSDGAVETLAEGICLPG